MRTKLSLIIAMLLAATAHSAAADDSYSFDPPAFDLDTTPSGSLVVAQGDGVWEIKNGSVEFVNSVPMLPGETVNGVATQGGGNIFATSSSSDLAIGAGVWRVDHDDVVLLGDIEAFETANDPDAFEGLAWKDQRCEFLPGVFTAGPQSNPYHLLAHRNEVFVADAAGNTVLVADRSGRLDWVAILTPPRDPFGEFMVLFPLPDGTDCYVQPVPTSVVMDEAGNLYVSELIGVPAIPGLARVWRIEAGARNVVCPSADCTMVVAGMTSIIDLAFGPNGMLYVLEYDEAGWLAATTGGALGGTLNRCDVSSGACTVVESGLVFPGAIAFDKHGQGWLLENNIIAPVVRRLAD